MSRLISLLKVKASKTSAFSRIVPVLLAGASIAAIQAPAKALIVNGSFEDISLPPSSLSSEIAGSTNITGWDVVGPGEVSIVSSPYTYFAVTFPAQDGTQWLDLTGINDIGCSTCGVSQNVPTTAGLDYTLSFYVGNVLSEDGIINSVPVALSINGGTPVPYFNMVDLPTQELKWTQFTIPITASGPTLLTFLNGGAPGDSVSALDNVSITAVPPSAVPGPLPLLGVGSAFLWSRRLRKRIKGQL
jgi:hypothetical protein